MKKKQVFDLIQSLPFRASIAVASRCARRVHPLLKDLQKEDSEIIRLSLQAVDDYSSGKDQFGVAASSVALDALKVGMRYGRTIESAANATGAAAGAVFYCETNSPEDLIHTYRSIMNPIYFSCGINNKIIDYAILDARRLCLMKFGEPGSRGAGIDACEDGPLGPLWPNGEEVG